ncbi:hypothetical protein H072_9219 [Dactylellina haptotyla CBS 200.50]|uniref:Uncharacterized protein n=1 Tax=Dactylellina haptotyla (strain CBS 200.50) TaxID=1284197 RepID=S8BD84_DACHA|nr:hypothetical protein H072_9219 [Dactylellina haptotyla CBS 200.50]
MKHQHHPHRRALEQEPVAAIPNNIAEQPAPTLLIRNVIQARATPSPTDESGCAPDDTSPRCEKPVSSSTMTLPVVLGAAIPIVAAIIILIVLHRRHVRKLKAEDRMDKTKSMDFGMEYPSSGKKKKGKKGTPINTSGRHKNQLSLDMDVAAPYLLPPQLSGSRESLHSMSRVYIADDDKYKPSNSINRMPYGSGSAAPSVNSRDPRSASRLGRESSIYTASIRQHEDSTESLTADLLGHSGKMATSSPPARGASLPSNKNMLPELQVPEPAFDTTRGMSNNTSSHGPGLFASHADERDSYIDADGGDLRRSHLHLLPHIGFNGPAELDSSKNDKRENESQISSVELPDSHPKIPTTNEFQASHSHQPPQLKLNQETSGAFDGLDFGTGMTRNNELDSTSQGRVAVPHSDDSYLPQVVEPEEQPIPVRHQVRSSTMGGLEVNYGDRLEPRRLSYGFRPLPPAAEPGEDAEERAMRIRSFYKEYFDDTNQGGLEYYAQAPEPTDRTGYSGDGYSEYPVNPHIDYDNQGYYEQDYSQGYNQEYGDYYQDNTGPGYEDQYYDDTYTEHPRPFAEPPARRAMTPPPRAPPRNFNKAPRPGSSSSNRGPPPPRSYSSQSNRYNGPPSRGIRAPSSLRKNALPEEPLLILPTPHLLKEDAFASPIGFAPAPRSKEYRAGTESEVGSVRGGMRSYSPTVRAHTPLASAFEDLSALPNPHQLRKSSTFTGLDFAPPRKFKNETDNFSDTGSIRSNRTGLSAAYNSRTGAYRVSRLPQDVVPTTENITSNLKPTWNMHNN